MHVDFKKPLFVDRPIRVEGKVQKVNSEREAILEGSIYNADNEICATSTSVAALFSVNALRKMGLADEHMLRRMDQLMPVSSIDDLKSI